MYPACSLLAEIFRAARAWRREGRGNHAFLLSRIIGLKVSRHDGLAPYSESLDHRHLWQYSWMPQESRTALRIFQALTLLLTSSQCLGTLIRTISRMFMGRHPPTMRGFLAEDFESFFLSIGTLAVLVKSWLAFAVNVEWRSDYENAPRSLDISSRSQRQRRTGIFTERDSHLSPTEIISEIFLEFQTRAILLLILYLTCWIVLGILSGRA